MPRKAKEITMTKAIKNLISELLLEEYNSSKASHDYQHFLLNQSPEYRVQPIENEAELAKATRLLQKHMANLLDAIVEINNTPTID